MLKRALPPSHPGTVLRELFMNERDLTITALAKGLGMTRANVSAIVKGRAGISPERKVKRSSIRSFKLPARRQSAHA